MFRQKPTHYTTGSGLSSSENYYIKQDKRGYIWICSDRGLLRFDNFDFKLYHKPDGLPENSVIKPIAEIDSTTWFISLNDLVFYYEHNRIIDPGINAHLRILNKQYDFRDLIVTQRNSIIAGYSDGEGNALIYDISEDTAMLIDKIQFPFLRSYLVYHYEDYTLNVWGSGKQTQTEKTLQRTSQGHLLVNLADSVFNFHASGKVNCRYHKLSRQSELLFLNKSVFLLSNGKLTDSIQLDDFPSDIKQFDSLLLVTLPKKGIYKIDLASFEPELLITGELFSSIMVDHQKNVWVTTLNNGIFKYANTTDDFYPYTGVDRVSCGLEDGKILLYDSYSGFRLINPVLETITPLKSRAFGSVRKIEHKKNKLFLSTGGGLFLGHLAEDSIRWVGTKIGGAPKAIELTNQLLFAGKQSGIVVTDLNDSLIFSSFKERSHFRVHDLISTLNGELLIGCSEGILQYEDGKIKEWRKGAPWSNSRVNSLCELTNGVAIGTIGDGVYIARNNTYYHLDNQSGLSSPFVNDLYFQDDLLYVASSRGVQVFKSDSAKFQLLYRLNRSNFLPFDDIRNILSVHKHIALETHDGVVVIPAVDSLVTPAPGPLFISEISVDGETHSLTNAIDLNYDFNKLKITVTALDFRSDKPQLVYRIDGESESWVHLNDNVLELYFLPAGESVIQIGLLGGLNDNFPLKTIKLKAKVNRPIYYKLWFIILFAAMIVTLIYLYYRYQLYEIRKEKELKEQLQTLEQEMLKSQMNPHFLFNAMNSIQSFIATNDKAMAYEYIGRFSRVMRNFLDFGEKNTIPLQEEIDNLTDYIVLESIRFEGLFTYEFHLSEEVQKRMHELEIPTYLLQPVVENAIEHGIRPLNQGGHIDLYFDVRDNLIEVRIRDNGIGLSKGKAMQRQQKPGHRSFGLKNVQRRIELLKGNKGPTQFIIKDREIESNQTGTEVHFIFEID